MIESCHHRNIQEKIYSLCFKQYGEYQIKVLSYVKPLLLFILYDLLFSHDPYHINDWDDTKNIYGLDCVYIQYGCYAYN